MCTTFCKFAKKLALVADYKTFEPMDRHDHIYIRLYNVDIFWDHSRLYKAHDDDAKKKSFNFHFFETYGIVFLYKMCIN